MKLWEKVSNTMDVGDLNNESEFLLIYMKYSLTIDSDVFIFPIEETEDDILFEKKGVKYVQLFAVYHALELIEPDLKGKRGTDSKIAESLLEYRLKDACGSSNK